MPVAIVASLLGLVAVLVAYYRDPPMAERRVEAPDWDVLPDPGDLARVEFPIAVPGYDPATVEFHFDLVTRAYGDLLAVAPPEIVARARHRAAVRLGLDPDAIPPPPTRAVEQPPGTALSIAVAGEGADAEALRAEAALADLDAQSATRHEDVASRHEDVASRHEDVASRDEERPGDS
jgi:hypothetical protein